MKTFENFINTFIKDNLEDSKDTQYIYIIQSNDWSDYYVEDEDEIEKMVLAYLSDNGFELNHDYDLIESNKDGYNISYIYQNGVDYENISILRKEKIQNWFIDAREIHKKNNTSKFKI